MKQVEMHLFSQKDGRLATQQWPVWVGTVVATVEGKLVMAGVGSRVGTMVGGAVGMWVGRPVGTVVGTVVGTWVGMKVGTVVGSWIQGIAAMPQATCQNQGCQP